MESQSQSLGLSYTSHKYGSHSLQRLVLWEFDDGVDRTGGNWVIFIHGGAWRDPRETADAFWSTVRALVSSSDAASSGVRGFASIDYRLSPHPDYPQDPAGTPEDELRVATHPDHILDIYAALAYLRNNRQLTEKYILLGHSAGATMAYQLLMGDAVLSGAPHPEVPLPMAIIGTAGIYDLEAIDDRHQGGYSAFIARAFGNDKELWVKVSPARFNGSFSQNGRRDILAWSSQDSLVDEPEIDNMAAKLKGDGATITIRKDLAGDHDDVWINGTEYASLIREALDSLKE